VRAKKRLGQHFLPHSSILERIVDALDPKPGDAVLEIGPGRGALTAVLLARGARLSAIEKDPDLIASLRERFPALTLVEADALEVRWREAAGLGPADPFLVVGNIPYNVTSPLLDKALEPPRPARIVYLVQREVADRLGAAPGSTEYGALTVGVRAAATVQRLFTVPAGAFVPRPRVDSALIRLTPLAAPLIPDADTAGFRRFVVAIFGARRKQLVRGLRTALGLEAAAAVRALRAAGIEAEARPETLSPEAFVRLFRAVVDEGGAPA